MRGGYSDWPRTRTVRVTLYRRRRAHRHRRQRRVYTYAESLFSFFVLFFFFFFFFHSPGSRPRFIPKSPTRATGTFVALPSYRPHGYFYFLYRKHPSTRIWYTYAHVVVLLISYYTKKIEFEIKKNNTPSISRSEMYNRHQRNHRRHQHGL